jgi:glycine oxidase
LTAGALGLMPSLAAGSVVRTWSGLRPESVTRQPVMGEIPGAAGLFVAAGHYKTGVGLSAVTGRVMAELIVDGGASVDLSAFSPSQPHD